MDTITMIKSLTKERHWSQYRLSRESGLAMSTISNIFTRDTLPSVVTLEAVCKAFNLSLSEFFQMIEIANGNEKKTDEQKLLHYWRTLLPIQQKIVMETAQHMNDK